jgi:hypothetical protein
MPAMASAFSSPAEAVARGVVKVLKTDKPELVIMPGPGRLMKALMDFFPGMGPRMNQRAGVTARMKQVADLREQEHAQGDASSRHPAERHGMYEK